MATQAEADGEEGTQCFHVRCKSCACKHDMCDGRFSVCLHYRSLALLISRSLDLSRSHSHCCSPSFPGFVVRSISCPLFCALHRFLSLSPPLSRALSFVLSCPLYLSCSIARSLSRASALSHTRSHAHSHLLSLLLTLSRCISALPDATHLQLVSK